MSGQIRLKWLDSLAAGLLAPLFILAFIPLLVVIGLVAIVAFPVMGLLGLLEVNVKPLTEPKLSRVVKVKDQEEAGDAH